MWYLWNIRIFNENGTQIEKLVLSIHWQVGKQFSNLKIVDHARLSLKFVLFQFITYCLQGQVNYSMHFTLHHWMQKMVKVGSIIWLISWFSIEICFWVITRSSLKTRFCVIRHLKKRYKWDKFSFVFETSDARIVKRHFLI